MIHSFSAGCCEPVFPEQPPRGSASEACSVFRTLGPPPAPSQASHFPLGGGAETPKQRAWRSTGSQVTFLAPNYQALPVSFLLYGWNSQGSSNEDTVTAFGHHEQHVNPQGQGVTRHSLATSTVGRLSHLLAGSILLSLNSGCSLPSPHLLPPLSVTPAPASHTSARASVRTRLQPSHTDQRQEPYSLESDGERCGSTREQSLSSIIFGETVANGTPK